MATNEAMASDRPATSGIVGAIAFWVVAIALSFITAPLKDVPGWVWALRIGIILAGVGYVIYLIYRESQQRSSDSEPFDLWTIAHTTAGLVMGAWGVPFPLVVIFTIAWEFFEKYVPGFGDKETFANRVVDVAVAWVGWILVAGLIALGSQIPMPWLLPAPQSIVGGWFE